MKLLIDVREEHVRLGMRDCPNFCPVKLATDPRLNAFWKCKVYSFVISIGNARGSWVDVKLPPEVSERIDRYDQTGVMEPFQFELWIPDAMFL